MSFFTKYKTNNPNCVVCGYSKKCVNKKIGIIGKGKKGILIVVGNPSKIDDAHNKPLTGSRFDALNKLLNKHKVSLTTDCWVVNAIRCRPGLDKEGNVKEPKPKHITACRPLLVETIEKLKPSKIVLFGDVAVQSFYNDVQKYVSNAASSFGLKFWDSVFNTWVFPMLDVSVLVDNKWDKHIISEFDRCIYRACTHTYKPLTKKWNPIHIIRNYKDTITALKSVLKYEKIIALDYETTGLNFWQKGHKTVSFSWGTSKGAWAVLVQHPYYTDKQQKQITALVCRILASKRIKKIVHNLGYEYIWTKTQLKTQPENIFYDTQLATHVLDTRRSITKLKFQAFMRWGIREYDTLSQKYIQSDESGFNKMLSMPIDALLEYNALDALYTYELYKEQLTEFANKKELKAYKFFHEGNIVLCEMQINGILVNKSLYKQQRKKLNKTRKRIVNRINNSKEASAYRKKYRTKFDYNSPKHLQKMLFDVMQLASIKKTKTGDSVDAEVLSKLNVPLTRDILRVRKIDKIISTYIDGFLSRMYGDYLHPSFLLTIARSLRSSAINPNFQNIPKRDPQAKRIARSGIVPRPGCVLGEMDFAGAEISTSCYYHKDPVFIEYQTDGGGDMHKDASAEILKIKVSEVPKQVRQATKGVWTFAQFYGSYYKSCAKKGWEEYQLVVDQNGNPIKIRNQEIGDYMSKTFGSYKNFENHLKKFEHKFWNEWFKVYTQWKDTVCDTYIERGYVETFFGFRFKGSLSRNQCTNYPIQGSSFHLLLYTIIQFYKKAKKLKLKTLIIGQIHDSLVLDIPVNEIDIVYKLLYDIVSNLHKHFKWMDFPMGLDFEISKPHEEGGNFSEMHKYS